MLGLKYQNDNQTRILLYILINVVLCVQVAALYWHPIMKKVHVTTMYITLLLSNTLCGQWLTIKEQIWRRKNVFFVRPLQNNTFIIYEPSLVCYPSIYVKLHKCSPTKQKVKASVWNFYLIKDLNCFPKFLCFLNHNSSCDKIYLKIRTFHDYL